MNHVEKRPAAREERPLEELAKAAAIGAIGVVFLTCAFWAMWIATPW